MPGRRVLLPNENRNCFLKQTCYSYLNNVIERETGYRQISLEMTGMCVIRLHSAHMTAFGGIQRFTLILLFTVSIRFHFLCPLSCSAGVPSHLPCCAAPCSASALINLAFELWEDGELKRYAVDQP